jgi:hypothetical protein
VTPTRPATILLVVIARYSHLNPLAPVHHWLVRRGHDVRVAFALGAPPRGFDLSGIWWRAKTTEVFDRTCYSPPEKHSGHRETIAELQDPERRAHVYAEVLLHDLTDRVAFLDEVIASVRPELIVGDPLAYEGPISAERAGVPWLALATDFAPAVDVGRLHDPFEQAAERATPTIARALSEHGWSSPRLHRCGAMSKHGNMVPGVGAWFGDGDPTISAVGAPTPRIAGSLTRRFPGKPLVTIAFGSAVELPIDFISRFVRAAADVDAEFLVGARRYASECVEPIPPNVTCSDVIPQTLALEQSAVAIHHGGANSFLEATYFGVPQIIVPLHGDQFCTARIGETIGAARTIDATDASADTIRVALEETLAEGPRARARVAVHAQALRSVRYEDEVGRNVERMLRHPSVTQADAASTKYLSGEREPGRDPSEAARAR